MHDWNKLTSLSKGEKIIVERVRLADSGIAIEGEFEPPPLAAIEAEDQIFMAAFIRSHGSIKEMERLFGVSYPTIKNRLNRLGEAFGFVSVTPVTVAPMRKEILDKLERGEITVEEATRELKGL
ncbi:MAG: DUF2089 domain-containing protein [Planctomycetota bacterium]|jgi:hypothetical protein